MRAGVIILLLMAAGTAMTWLAGNARSPEPRSPGVTFTVTVDGLVAECDVESATGLLAAFQHAWNASAAAALKRNLPEADGQPDFGALLATAVGDPVAVAEASVPLRWISITAEEFDPLIAHDLTTLDAIVASRHGHADTITLTLVELFRGVLPGTVDVHLVGTRQADDLPARRVEGKAGIDCDPPTIYLLTLADDPRE